MITVYRFALKLPKGYRDAFILQTVDSPLCWASRPDFFFDYDALAFGRVWKDPEGTYVLEGLQFVTEVDGDDLMWDVGKGTYTAYDIRELVKEYGPLAATLAGSYRIGPDGAALAPATGLPVPESEAD